MSLNEASGFDKIEKYYQENKDKPWQEWLKVKTVFPRPGKQGLVGLMSAKNDESILYVFKVSQYINYLVQHELSVMQSLNDLAEFCPHFCKSVGGIMCVVDPMKRKEGNPFECENKFSIEKEVLLSEYLHNSYKFYNYIISEKVPENVLYSTVKQCLLAVAIAQRKKRFTHYDLHSNNLMMKKCSKDLVFLYVLDENNQFCVATRGHYPVVIDFGFSYAGDMDGGYLWQTLNHTEVGFMSDRFDPIADPKLFLVTVSDEINNARKTKNSKKLKNITKNLYKELKIDWNSGWDNDTQECATDSVLQVLDKYRKVSKLFKEYDYYCMDIIQTLIVLPLQEQKCDNILISYKTFLDEFIKIENEISTPFFCLYILKGIVDAARTVRMDYKKKETRDQAIGYFQTSIYERIDSIASYCRPQNVHFEKMLCSLLCFSRGVEGILYKTMNKRMKIKNKMYKKVPLKTPEEICAVIDMNIKDDYEFNKNTVVMVLDCIKNSCYELSLNDEQIDDINSYESICRGHELYKISLSQSLNSTHF